jgi:hypothetical protein
MSNVHLRVAAVSVLALVAACGGSGSTGTSTAPAAASTTATTIDPGTIGASPDAPANEASSAVVTEPPSGDGTVGSVCELVTEEELAEILGMQVNTTVFAGPPDTCDVQSTDNAALAAFVLTNMGGVSASAVYDAFASDPGSSEIPGIGEKAAYNPNQAVLVILNNGAVLTVAVFDDGTMDEAARVELMKQIGTIAAGRM